MSNTAHTMVYILVEADTSEKLQQQVNALIMKGYRPHGSIAVALSRDYEFYIQPMMLEGTLQ